MNGQFENNIPVVYACDENFAMPTSVSIISLLQNAHSSTFYKVYILVPNSFASKSKISIKSITGSFSNCSIEFICMDDAFEDSFIGIKHISYVTYYRLAIDGIIVDRNKCIYLDSDTIITEDLSDLYNTEMGDYFIAGVKAPSYVLSSVHYKKINLPDTRQYINAGVLLMNLEKIRESGISKSFLNLIKNKYQAQDQDIINFACYKKILNIDIRYNMMTKYVLKENGKYVPDDNIDRVFPITEIHDAINNPAIIHYADKKKPWSDFGVPYADLWFKYAVITPLWTYKQELNTAINISVILPVYNVEKYLVQCIDSILNQTFRDFELICVDDGSSDTSGNILDIYEKIDKRIIVIHKENRGAGAARNVALEIARAPFLSFLDADDFFEKDMLEIAYKRAIELDTDIVVYRSNQYLQDENTYVDTNWTIRMNDLPKETVFSGNDIDAVLFRVFVGWPWDKLFRTSFIQKMQLSFQEIRVFNDMKFVLSALATAEKITVVDKVLAHRRMRAGSITDTRNEYWWCVNDALLGLRDSLVTLNVYDRYEQDYLNYAMYLYMRTLDSIKGYELCLYYNKLRAEWFVELGFCDHPSSYFYDDLLYERYKQIVSLSFEDYILMKYLEVKQDYTLLRADSTAMKKQLDFANDRLEWNRNKRHEYEKRIKSGLKQSNDTILREQYIYIERELLGIKSSLSYKIGRVITYLPRLLRDNLFVKRRP